MSVKFHTLRREQWISRPVGEVFEFFSDARNLREITPPWLGFHIVSISSDPIAKGTGIRYRLNLHGLPIRWKSVIRVWDPPRRFVDVQTSGPYRLWHHTHRFENHGSRTRIVDVVRYALPFGILGRIANALLVRGDVTRIFDYRRRRIQEIFEQPSIESNPSPKT